MIELQYNETVRTERLTDVALTNKKTYVANLTGVSCHVQPLDPSITPDISGGFGKDFLMFCEPVDIVESDRVFRTINAVEKEYRVQSVESMSFMGNEHMEVLIRIFES